MNMKNKDLEIRKKLYEMYKARTSNKVLSEDTESKNRFKSRVTDLVQYLDGWYNKYIARTTVKDLDEYGWGADADDSFLDFRNTLHQLSLIPNNFDSYIKEEVEVIVGGQNLTDPDKAFEEPIEEQNKKNAVADMLNTLIIDEWEAIKGYDDTIVTLQSEGLSPEIIDTLRDIAREENIHVGQLQKCLEQVSSAAKEIKKGEEEAEKQIDGEVVEHD